MSILVHLNEDLLECYAMNGLSEFDLELVEDHVSLCQDCGDRLDITAEYLNVMRTVLHKQADEQSFSSRFADQISEWLHSTVPLWAAGTATAAILLLAVMRPAPLPAVVAVVVSGTRGKSIIVHGTGPFDFQLFMPEEAAKYHVDLVNVTGRKRWESDVAGHQGHLHAVVNERIAAGQYFLRATEPVSKAVHEYSVKIER